MSGMQEPSSLNNVELERARDLGGATYLSAYVTLMARQLGLDDADKEALRAFALQMLIPVNLATEAAWFALMHDDEKMNERIQELQAVLNGMV